MSESERIYHVESPEAKRIRTLEVALREIVDVDCGNICHALADTVLTPQEPKAYYERPLSEEALERIAWWLR